MIAVLLVLLAFSGFMNAFIWIGLRDSLPPDAPAHLRAWLDAFASPIVSAAAIFYGLTALCAAVGVWRMSAWAPPAILAWGVAVFILGGIFVLVTPRILDPTAGPGILALVAVIVLSMWAYVRRQTSRFEL